uniref:PWWP domain-containing protein n=1 Tax=Aegilops tauschii subsp. strangulata TaxID=200361 RepID=A0A453S9L4_AEGTS
ASPPLARPTPTDLLCSPIQRGCGRTQGKKVAEGLAAQWIPPQIRSPEATNGPELRSSGTSSSPRSRVTLSGQPRPEDWNQEPAPRKFFVLFFGTREIAFVALHDLLPFTEEVKSDLVNQAREKRFPKRHAKGLEEALVEVQKAYDELPKSSETSNGLFPNRTPDPIEKPTEPLVKPPTDGWTPKLEQIDDFDGRYLSLKREERDVPKSSETANGLLHDQTPDPVEKPTEPLVKP